MFDSALAHRALDDALANHERYKQNVFRCRTAMCYAGFIVHAAGGRWKVANPREASNKHELEVVVMPNGEDGHVSDIAASLLAPGASYQDVYDYFFASTLSSAQIRVNIDRWTADASR